MRPKYGVSEPASGKLAAAWRAVRRAVSSIFGGAVRRLRDSTWVAPALKVAVGVVGLVLLAWLGQRASSHVAIPQASAATDIAPAVSIVATAVAPAPMPSAVPAPTTRASPDSPVVLNTATLEDLERLPGIGPKRARSILDQRARQGRFRQIEDLMKVKGIGRTTIRRLRPLVRVDPPSEHDASAE
jgi:competence protein ComEA